eukprot:6375624-Prymnesium_polylepis.1
MDIHLPYLDAPEPEAKAAAPPTEDYSGLGNTAEPNVLVLGGMIMIEVGAVPPNATHPPPSH